ncbi:MAG: hypothetical protein IPN29_11880 [Saprospiraceae bacterium]|nr:hypothetical protein [Saprospiraceae bacterium]
MIERISFHYPWWFIIFCLLAGAIYAYLLYRKESRFTDGPAWLKPVMAALRAMAIFIITLLLLSPIIKSITEDKKEPIVIIAEDRSTSIKSGTATEKLAVYKNKLSEIEGKIGSKFAVETLFFGDKVSNDSFTGFSSSSTNLSEGIQYIYDNYADQNVGAIVITSDGIFNEGSHPAYTNVNFNAPVYTVALGDTSIRKDVVVKNVLYNKIAYLGDKFPIQIDLAAYNFKGSSAKLRIEKSGEQRRVITEQSININDPSFFNSSEIMLDADQTGIVRYSISVIPLPGEISTANNKRDIYIEVLDGRQQVLILANAPHPDISAFQNLISSNKNYKVTTAIAGFDRPNLSAYDLIILHNLPSDDHDLSAELTIIKNKQLPLLFVAGTQINQVRFNQIQEVINIRGNTRTNEDAEAALNADFDLFTLSEDLKSQVQKFPPLTSSFGTYTLEPGAEALFYQKIKKIPTRYPLIAFSEKSGVRTGVLAGEGIWKWRISEFADYQNNERVAELTNKMVQLLTVKEDKRKFKVNLSKQIYKDNESIVFDAQLYNDAFEMINEPDVFLVIKNEKRAEFKYNFSKTNNYYTLDAGQFPEGNYSYTATTVYKGIPQTYNGRFTVQSIQLEAYELTARHDVLFTLSQKFNGRMFLVENMEALADSILQNKSLKPVIFQTTQSKTLIHYKWLFFVILLFLSAEWFLRRYYGSY